VGSDFAGLRVTIVGDVRHSRVARSNVAALSALGAKITLVAPRTLLPPSLEGWPVEATSDLDAVLPETDVCYLLRLQAERMVGPLIPDLDEYARRFGLHRDRAERLPKGALILHPGPMNRGIEIDDDVTALDRAVIVDQVRNGVAVRMAVLYLLLGVPGALGADRVIDEVGATNGVERG
jgi:aspartate carbamoyltransferase catalytic subunit